MQTQEQRTERMMDVPIDTLISGLQWAPSPDNTQPIRYRWDGDSLTAVYDADRVAGITFGPEHPATLISVGAAIENLVQLAVETGLKAVIDKFPADENGGYAYFRAKFSWLDDGAAELRDLQDLPLFSRHTNRFPFKTDPVPMGVVDWVEQVRVGGGRAIFLDQKAKLVEVSKLVRSASEVRFQTKEVHEWLAHSLRFGSNEAERGDGLDVASLDLPPGGNAFLRLIANWRRMRFLNRFGLYKVLASIEAMPISKAPGLVAIVGPRDKGEVVNAGRLLERVWIEFNTKGLAVHPYYVVSDQLHRAMDGSVPAALVPEVDAMANQCAEAFGFREGESLQMLLRVGFPKKTPPRSRRLPIRHVFSREHKN